MGKSINISDLPYLSHYPQDDRAIVLLPYYDDIAKQFYHFLPVQDRQNELWMLPANKLIEGIYFSGTPVNEQDSRLPFLETILQHFSFKKVISEANKIQADLINGLASLHKYFVLLEYAGTHKDNSCASMVKTELEYAFANHRAFYDCLIRIIDVIHRRFNPTAPELPSSFHKVVRKSKSDLAEKYSLPQSLIDFFKGREKIFFTIKSVRDKILHHGQSTVQTIFEFPGEGFAISVDDQFAKKLGNVQPLWPSSLMKANRLGSVLAILVFFVKDMFSAMQEVKVAIINCISLLPLRPIASRCELFLRSPLSKHLVLLNEYQNKHWFDPKAVLETHRRDKPVPPS